MNVPKLRFSEFEREWKTIKIQNIYEIKNGLNKGKEFFGHGILILNYMDVNKNVFNDNKTIKGLVDLNEDEIERYSVNHNDLFFTRTSETSDEIGLTSSYIGKKIRCVFSGFLLRARPLKNNVNSLFYAYYFRSPENRQKIIKHSSITTRALISGSNLSQINVHLPDLGEQEKIASFLSKIDKKIEKLEKKEQLWQTYKNGMMQQLFSQKLRFKDENGSEYPDWKEKKLNNISKLTSSKRVYLADYTKNGIPFYRGKEISNLRKGETIEDLLYISKSKYNEFKEKFDVPKKNDILITAVGTLGNVYRVVDDEPFYFKDGNLIWLKKIKENPYFLEYALEYNKKAILSSSIGSTQKALTIVELNKVKIKIPSLQEQTKIAYFISSIDKKIKNIKKELKINIKFKKGLLQQLFPSDKKSIDIEIKNFSEHNQTEHKALL